MPVFEDSADTLRQQPPSAGQHETGQHETGYDAEQGSEGSDEPEDGDDTTHRIAPPPN